MMGMNPKMMEQMMRQMGIKQTPVDADEVIIVSGNKRTVIRDPQVIMIEAQGQKTFQVIGEPREEPLEKISEEDLKMVMEKTGCSKEDAEKALKESDGDIAEAIMALS